MMRKNIILNLITGLLAVASAGNASAQDENDVNSSVRDQMDLITDRPDQTESAEVVPLYSLQIETGINHEWEETGTESYLNSTEYGGTLLRFGIHQILEARLGTSLLKTRWKLQGLDAGGRLGMTPLNLGLKAKILKENGLIPDVAIIASFQILSLNVKYIYCPIFAKGHLLGLLPCGGLSV